MDATLLGAWAASHVASELKAANHIAPRITTFPRLAPHPCSHYCTYWTGLSRREGDPPQKEKRPPPMSGLSSNPPCGVCWHHTERDQRTADLSYKGRLTPPQHASWQ